MNAPLYQALVELARQEPLRLHMPGHKGRMTGPFSEIAALDFTELPPTGNLYDGEGPVREAESLFARLGGAKDALFFSCGATQGIQTMLAGAVGSGGTLILDRGCHQSVYHAMALLDITPVYLLPPLDPETGLPEPVSPVMLENALRAHPQAKAVLLTSPSYYGMRTDLRPLANCCHDYGVHLLVDQAHGAHFPFVGLPTGVEEGADLCVVSAHKTLPALGSSSILYVGKTAPWDALTLKSLSAIFSTTSPSWPILASIDYARAALEKLIADLEGGEYGLAFASGLAAINTVLSLFLTVDTGTLTGFEADRLLREKHIYLEMADERYLVAIVTCMDTWKDLSRFLDALKVLPAGTSAIDVPISPPEPISRLSLRQALLGPCEKQPLVRATGRIAARIVAPYPPGIPILAPGEEITEKHIAYLQKKRYNMDRDIRVVPQEKEEPT